MPGWRGVRRIGRQPVSGVGQARKLPPGVILGLGVGGQLAAPALDLPLQEPLGPAEALQADRAVIDIGQPGDAVDQGEAQIAAALARPVERRGRRLAVTQPAVDQGHQVEAHADHRRIIAIGDEAGVRHIRPGESRQDPGLAADDLLAVGTWPLRRPAQHHLGAAPPDRHDQVAGPAAEHPDLQGAIAHAGRVGVEPGGQPDLFLARHSGRCARRRHFARLTVY
jgi:hypothetical protein